MEISFRNMIIIASIPILLSIGVGILSQDGNWAVWGIQLWLGIYAIAGIAWLAGKFIGFVRAEILPHLWPLLAIVFISMIVGAMFVGSATPTQPPETWSAIKAELGLDPGTRFPEGTNSKNELMGLVRSSHRLPIFPDREKFVDRITESARWLRVDEVQKGVREANQAYAEYKKQRADALLEIPPGVPLLVIGIILVCAVIGAFLGYSLKSDDLVIGKITGTLLWAIITFGAFSLFWLFGNQEKEMAMNVFAWGFLIQFGSMGLALFGVGVVILGDKIPDQSGWKKWVLTIVLTIVGTLLGLRVDSLFQVPLLAEAVKNADNLLLQEVYLAYHLGSIAGGGITALVAGAVINAQQFTTITQSARRDALNP